MDPLTAIATILKCLVSVAVTIGPLILAARLGTKSTQLDQANADLAAKQQELLAAANAPHTIDAAIAQL